MKHKNIELDGLDIEIDIDAAKSYIEFRALAKKPLTQRAFDQAMNKALEGFRVNMTPTEVIDYTVDKGWLGINLDWIASSKAKEMPVLNMHGANVVPIGRSTRDISLEQELSDRSWAD